MIQDVSIKRIETHPDDRGHFREILRDDDHLLKKFGQCSITKTYPGVIKAFHWHEKQDDLWYTVSGAAQVVLYDRRPGSPTFGQTDVCYTGEFSQLLVCIPRGVAHGYRVLGNEPVVMLYFTTEPYNRDAPDEQRIPYDDPSVHFDWNTKNR